MNREKIKLQAKEMIKGNIWNLLLPFIITELISFGLYSLFGAYSDNESYLTSVSYIISIALCPLQLGCIAYILKFIRKEPYDIKLIFSYYNIFIYVFALYFLISLFSLLWALLFIIPGIIAALSYTLAPYLMIDGEKDPLECIKKSKKMMMGYKWDYLVFNLSFLGWILLSILTCGILLIYVIPYISVSQLIYYEEIKKIN